MDCKNCLIFSGGEYSVPEDFPFDEYDLILACDKGYEYAKRSGVQPRLIIGDFDSAPPPDLEIPFLKYPVEKDDTDTMLAIRHALHMGCENIDILCGLGKRMDHAFANVQSCAFAAVNGASASLLSRRENLFVFPPSERAFPKKEGWNFACFALSDHVTGLTIDGAKYPLQHGEILNTFPIGTSNDWAADSITIHYETGILLIIESKTR